MHGRCRIFSLEITRKRKTAGLKAVVAKMGKEKKRDIEIREERGREQRKEQEETGKGGEGLVPMPNFWIRTRITVNGEHFVI